MEGQAARDLARQLEHLAARPALRVLRVLRLLPVGCLDKVEAAVAVAVLLARAVQAVPEAVVLVAAEAVLRALHTLLAPVVSVVQAGHWFWSFDHAAICRC